MNELSFGIQTSKDFLKKLLEDYEEFKLNPLSSRIALNCAMTSWHLSEWIFNEYKIEFDLKYNNITSFQNEVKKSCSSLQIMHDLANGTKHYYLTRHNPIVSESNIHEGAYSREYSREFDISYLYLLLKDGSKLIFDDEIEKVVNFWKEYFKTNFKIII
jgi:hypothetical protein